MKEIWHMVDKNGKRKKYIVDTETVLDGKLYFYQLTSEFIGTPFLYAYMKLTEPHKTDEWNALDRGELTPGQKAFKENVYLGALLPELRTLFQIASYNHMLEAYRAGTITPELQQILTTAPSVAMKDNGDGGYYSNALAALTGDENSFRQEVLQAAEAGKIDFSALAHDGNQEKDWFMKYRIAPNPLPGYYGSISTWEKLLPDGTPCLENYHKQTKEKIKKIVTDALRDGVNPEAVNTIANEIRDIYRRNRGTQRNTWNNIFRYRNSYEAGFVVDLEHGKIYDLRHYADELAELLEPGFDPLKEFYMLLNRYVTTYQNQEQTPAKLFENTPFIPLRNTPETNAITSVTGGITSMAVQTELPGMTDTGETLYNYETNVPTRRGEVLIKVSQTPKGRALLPSTQKLKVLCDTLFTKLTSRTFSFQIDEYMALCGKAINTESKKEFRKTLRANLRTLQRTTFSAKYPGVRAAGEIGILAAWLPGAKGTIQIALTPEYCAHLQKSKNGGIFSITDYLFKSDERNIHIIPFYLTLFKNRQIQKNVNKGGRRANTISIKSLIENDTDLMQKWKKKDINREYRRYIIDPVINVIDLLNKDGVIKSKYIDADGIEHTREELERVTIADFLDSKKWLLFYDIVGYKDDPAQLQAAAARLNEKRTQATAKTAARKKKKKETT